MTARRCRLLAVLAVLAVLGVTAALSAVVAPAPGATSAPTSAAAAPRKAPDRAFLGYRIPRHQRAASGFIGSRTLRGRVVYRTDPRRTAPVGGFVRAEWTADFRASGGRAVGRARTACAAQLLSYGRTQTLPRLKRLQAAGIDVAVLHLLSGGAYRHHGRAQVRRTNQVAKGSTIRAFAQNLVEDYCPLSGPYAVTLVADRASADVGDVVTYTAGVRSASGVPLERVRVVVQPPYGPATELRTDAKGQAVFAVEATGAGPFTTSISTRKLPPAQLRYLVPRRSGATRVAVAGLEQGAAHLRTRVIPVRALPTISLDPDRPVTRGKPFRLRFALRSGYAVARTAVLQVVGPLPASGSDCADGTVVRSARMEVTSNTTYAGPRFTLNRPGRYLWRVTVPGTTYNRRVSVCGGGFAVRS